MLALPSIAVVSLPKLEFLYVSCLRMNYVSGIPLAVSSWNTLGFCSVILAVLRQSLKCVL